MRLQFHPWEVVNAGDTTMWYLAVDMNIKTNASRDSVVLNTRVKLNAFFDSILAPNQIVANDLNSRQIKPLKTNIKYEDDSVLFNDCQVITVYTRGTQSFNLHYNVTGTSWFLDPVMELNPLHIYTYHVNDEYFYPKETHIDSIVVTAPDSLYVFGDLRQRSNNDVNLTFVSKDYVKCDSLLANNMKIYFYIKKTGCADSTYHANRDSLRSALCRLAQYTDINNTSSVIMIPYHGNDGSKYGMGFGNYAILDEKFGYKDMFHEILHLFFPSHIISNTKGRYFIGESVIEWLACYITNYDDPVRKKLYIGKGSLYDLQHNGPKEEEWSLVYNNGSEILNRIARDCGQKKLAKALVAFLEVANKREVTYDYFLKFMRDYLPMKEIKKMDLMVRNKIRVA